MYPIPAQWSSAPLLLIHQTFDDFFTTGASAEISTTNNPVFQRRNKSWRHQASAVDGGGLALIFAETYRPGHIFITSENSASSSGRTYAVGIDVAQTSLSTPTGLCQAKNVYRWDIWVKINTLTTSQFRFGVVDNLLGSVSVGAFISYVSSTSANWIFSTRQSGNNDVTSSVAVTASWHKLTGIRSYQTTAAADMWSFFVDDVLLGESTSNTPQSNVTIGAMTGPLANNFQSGMILHRVMLWTDGTDMVI